MNYELIISIISILIIRYYTIIITITIIIYAIILIIIITCYYTDKLCKINTEKLNILKIGKRFEIR